MIFAVLKTESLLHLVIELLPATGLYYDFECYIDIEFLLVYLQYNH